MKINWTWTNSFLQSLAHEEINRVSKSRCPRVWISVAQKNSSFKSIKLAERRKKKSGVQSIKMCSPVCAIELIMPKSDTIFFSSFVFGEDSFWSHCAPNERAGAEKRRCCTGGSSPWKQFKRKCLFTETRFIFLPIFFTLPSFFFSSLFGRGSPNGADELRPTAIKHNLNNFRYTWFCHIRNDYSANYFLLRMARPNSLPPLRHTQRRSTTAAHNRPLHTRTFHNSILVYWRQFYRMTIACTKSEKKKG